MKGMFGLESVQLYVQRHTANFNIARRILSTDELMNGRRLKDGRRMDVGTGLSNRTVIDALRSLARKRLIFPAEEESGQKSYALMECAPLTHPMKKGHRSAPLKRGPPVKKAHSTSEKSSSGLMNKAQCSSEESSQATPAGTRQQETRRDRRDTQIDPLAAPPRSPDGSPVLSDEKEEGQEEQPGLVTLRTQYATLSQQLEQLDAKKQAGQWARLYKHVQAAEARLRLTEQNTPFSPVASPEYAKQQEDQANEGETVLTLAEDSPADERQERLHALASDLLYWKGGLKVLRQAQLPKWRGYFIWQIEAKVEALQAAYAMLRTECAKPDG